MSKAVTLHPASQMPMRPQSIFCLATRQVSVNRAAGERIEKGVKELIGVGPAGRGLFYVRAQFGKALRRSSDISRTSGSTLA